MSQQEYITQQRKRPVQRTWYEILWDGIKGLFVQIVYSIIDGVVYWIKKEIRNYVYGSDDENWRNEWR